MGSTSERQVFIILTGVSGNLGDAVIRRRVLEWVRGTGEVHAYVGRTTPGWNEQLALTADEISYDVSQRRAWLKKLLIGRGKRALIFDPGEVPLGNPHLKSELMFLAVAVVLRVRGAKIVRPPRAVGDYSALVGGIYRLSALLSQEVLWRNSASYSLMKTGRLVPDTAYSEPLVPSIERSERSYVIVSLRGKRSYPSAVWFESVRQFAKDNAFRVKVVSQVDEDEARSEALAVELGDVADYEPWGSRSDLEQEIFVRDMYTRAAAVISDRLHVLILASLAGAQPIEAVDTPVPKAQEHFAVIGLEDMSIDTSKATLTEVLQFLNLQLGRQDQLNRNLATAAERLGGEVSRIRQLLTTRR
jgi:hypothetical protein